MKGNLRFLDASGDVAALMRAHDWSGSPLGPPERWPQSLRVVISLMLSSKFPMFVAWGPELGFLYNDAYVEILGEKHPAALGRRFEDIWSEIWDDLLPLIERALAGEATYLENLPLTMHRHGYDEQTWFTFSYSPVFDEHGVIAGMYCACTETTEAMLVARHRELEFERLRQLFQQAPGLIAALRGPEHVFEIANEAYIRLVGREDLVGRTVREALPEIEGQGLFHLLDRVYATGEPFIGQAVPVQLRRAPDAPLEERFIDFIYQPIRDEKGHVTGIFVEGSDVTDAMHAMAAVREAGRRKDEFLAMLAHELRNPLAPISTAARVLRMQASRDPHVEQASAIITRQVEHMVALVDDLLDVSRFTRGLVELQMECLDIRTVVAQAVEQARPLIDARNHVLSIVTGGGQFDVTGDRTRLTQVVTNLLNNAAKYTPSGGRIELGVEARGGHVCIVVADNGIGIDSALLPHVFTLFAQGERMPDRAQGGLGIGLALTRSIVELHHGTVEARSDGPGTGATFVVTLPRAECGQVPVRSPEPGLPRADGGKRAVLVVDDNVDAAQSLATLLAAVGHDVAVRHDGAAALAHARERAFDAYVLDIGLPDLDGYELARRLRAGVARDAVLIALTGYGQPQDRERSREAGFDEHLVKPADAQRLLDALVRARR